MVDDLTSDIYNKLNCKHEITKEYIKTLLNSIKRFEKKQEVYTTDNIADMGEQGLVTRIGDSYSRIKKYLSVSKEKREELMLTEDKINKDFIDLGVYGFIAYIYRSGNWR